MSHRDDQECSTSPKSPVTATGFEDAVSAQNAIEELISLLGLTSCFQKCQVMEM